MADAFDIVSLVTRHPRLFKQILVKSTGPLGELLVAERLMELGYAVHHPNSNRKQCDLVIETEIGSIEIEVKTGSARRPTWWVSSPPNPVPSRYWIFVRAPRALDQLPDANDIEYFVFSAEETAALWKGIVRRGVEKNVQDPRTADIRYHDVEKSGALDAWHKLPKPQAAPLVESSSAAS